MSTPPAAVGQAVFQTVLLAARGSGTQPIGSAGVFTELVRRRVPGASAELSRLMSGLPASVRRAAAGAGAVDTGAVPDEPPAVEPALRELRWRAGARVRWDPSVRHALAAALRAAGSAGVVRANLTHLAIGLLSEPAGPVTQLLSGAGVDRVALLGRVRADPAHARDGEPHTPLIADLEMTGDLDVPQAFVARVIGRAVRRSTVRCGRYGGALAWHLEDETRRQAVRAGAATATSAHLVAAIASLGAQLAAVGGRLVEARAPFNAAPQILAGHGVTLDTLVPVVGRVPADADVEPAEAEPAETVPPSTRELAAARDRAIRLARERCHRQVGSSHLLVAALAAGNGPAALLVRAAGADPTAIRAATLQTL